MGLGDATLPESSAGNPMTDEDIHEYVVQINTGIGRADLILDTPIADGVSHALVWRPYDHGGAFTEPASIFFIRDSNGQCIGAVVDAVSDLHVYTVPEFRRRGLMKRALMTVVFPWLAQVSQRKAQALTFRDPAIKAAFARMGFRSISARSSRRSLIALRYRRRASWMRLR